MPADDLIASLLSALAAQPDDVPMRLLVASMLLDAGRPTDALTDITQVIGKQESHPEALALLHRASDLLGRAPAEATSAQRPGEAADSPPDAAAPSGFDWSAAERDVGPIDHPLAEPAFVDIDDTPDNDPLSAYEVERPTLRLSDVGGRQDVKRRLDVAFLTPMRNPKLRAAFGKSLRGGLLLYGPPGCGKTFLARALAGELGHVSRVSAWPMFWTHTWVPVSAMCTPCSARLARRPPACCSWTRSMPWGRNVARCGAVSSGVRSTSC